MCIRDRTRTDLFHPVGDGSTALYYEKDKIIDDPKEMAKYILEKCEGFTMPGWEPERLAHVKELFEAYKDVGEQNLFDNLVYFLKKIQPVCEKHGIMMAIHPDDPAWPVFNLPRIINNKENILKLLNAVDSKFNGLTLCTGSLGSNPDNDICDIIKATKGRVHFAHIRNLRHHSPGKFEEAAHLSRDGSMDMYKIMKTLYETGFDGPIRPDHGRMIWGEVARPGYGLYDRALGVCYLNGLWEAVEKSRKGNK